MLRTLILKGESDLLSVENLSVSFRTDEGMITPVNGVSFSVEAGETLGVVGESGSGKSVSCKALMQLLPKTAEISRDSRIHFRGKQGRHWSIHDHTPNDRALSRLRGAEIGMIFQEPMASFSPVYTVGNQIIECIRRHRSISRREAKREAISLLERVGLSKPVTRVDQYPHELSGGMRQRAMIALALSAQPALLIADEPTTALDVTIQAQVLELLRELQMELEMAMIFITHDLGVIAQVADKVAVMYQGSVVEEGPTSALLETPAHPYTRGLLNALPRLDALDRRLQPVPGDIPAPGERPSGCAFHPRCSNRCDERCLQEVPLVTHVGDQHRVRCWMHVETVGLGGREWQADTGSCRELH